MSLYQSLYETTLKQGVPRPIIDVLARVFANDVDFQRSAAPGDSIEAFYSDPDDINPRPELLCASMTVRDQTFKYYRFQTPDDNMVDFYDENGRSMRKFLVRKPIAEGEMTSPFGMRYHPILHYARMHTGVDWAAPIGTPIFAAGNGTDHQGGLGRRLRAAGRNPARQRLRDHLQSHVRLRTRHRRGRARRPGPNHRLSRRNRIGDRAAPALRGDHQRQLRRPDGDQARPHARIRRQDARRVQARARAHRPAHGPVALGGGDGGGEARVCSRRRDGGASTERDRERAAGARSEPQRRANFARAQACSRAVRQATRIDGFSTVSLRYGRERAGGAGSAALDRRAAPEAAGGRRSRQRDRARARRRSRLAAHRRRPPPDGSSPPDRGR